MINLSKFTSNKKKNILNGVVVLGYNQICFQTLFFPFYYLMYLSFYDKFDKTINDHKWELNLNIIMLVNKFIHFIPHLN